MGCVNPRVHMQDIPCTVIPCTLTLGQSWSGGTFSKSQSASPALDPRIDFVSQCITKPSLTLNLPALDPQIIHVPLTLTLTLILRGHTILRGNNHSGCAVFIHPTRSYPRFSARSNDLSWLLQPLFTGLCHLSLGRVVDESQETVTSYRHRRCQC